ncbi:uncharacterized protein LOC131198648 [Ahaetulla prasina]|uniref:uncharacterized protein LOC131198648 n=1 Tax=Ahaetulla prasina TaxID=499056 RepID=UPI002648A92D|nr:uncharacterized protein LOC131198648 [Ahaetulla prasina]
MCPPDFRAFHWPRAQGRGGGVAIIINEGLEPREITVPQIARCETLFVKWGLGMQVSLLIMYLAPCCVTETLPELLNAIARMAVETPRLMVMGDFNLPSVGGASTSAREFMASMAALDLTQLVNGPIHFRGNTLDLIFLSGQWLDGLELGDLVIKPLTWSDHSLLQLDFRTADPHRRELEPVRWFHPRCLMDPESFQTELGPLSEDLAHGSAGDLVAAWERAAAGALDRVVPLRPLTWCQSRLAPWYSEELREMKRRRRRLESDQTLVRSQIQTYLVAMRVAKREYFSALIASADNRLAALFRVTRSLLHQRAVEDPLHGHAEKFGQYLHYKIAQIREGLDSEWVGSGGMAEAGLEVTIWDEFDTVAPEDMDRILGRLNVTTCLLDPCPSWLVLATREVTRGWLQGIVNASLM